MNVTNNDMTREEAIRELAGMYQIIMIDSLKATQEAYRKNFAIDMAISALEAEENPIEEIALNYGLTPEGVKFALEQYQKVICEITHGLLSKLNYYAEDLLRLANDINCERCELTELYNAENVMQDEKGSHCPNCGELLAEVCGDVDVLIMDDEPKYCPYCGKAVKWK